MKKIIFPVAILSILIASCKKEEVIPATATPTPTVVETYSNQIQQVKETYANLAFSVYDDAFLSVSELKIACESFVANPTSANHLAAKDAWLASREIYGQSEIFRFSEGPIDNATDGPEGLINAWPMDEAYVDYTIGSANSGIINNLTDYPTINAATLIGANEFAGETNISLGFHAIEFLLWGQDLSSTSAGARPYTDFVVGGTASNQARRAKYLTVCAGILVDGLEQVKNEWSTSGSNYRAEWLAMDNKTALRKMFNSIRAMQGTELSGERIYTAYDNEDQEDEHSCFSDNTHRDIALNAQGVSNLYKGEYTRKSGTQITGFALEDLVNLVSSSKNSEFLNLRIKSDTDISEMYIPFDQAIVLPTERPKVLESVESLQSEETKILEIALLFDIIF